MLSPTCYKKCNKKERYNINTTSVNDKRLHFAVFLLFIWKPFALLKNRCIWHWRSWLPGQKSLLPRHFSQIKKADNLIWLSALTGVRNETRTHTSVSSLPPQSSASTNSAIRTWFRLTSCHIGRWAKNGTRTRDPNLGKVVLYQLSYFRICFANARFLLRSVIEVNFITLAYRKNSAESLSLICGCKVTAFFWYDQMFLWRFLMFTFNRLCLSFLCMIFLCYLLLFIHKLVAFMAK